jgi:nitrite reductase (NADH) small subunit
MSTAPTTLPTRLPAGYGDVAYHDVDAASESSHARQSPRWHRVCRLDDLEEAWGEAALIAGRQVALIRLGAEVFAVSHRDPVTGSHVVARGIVGSRGSRPTIASPLLKQVYDLQTGECYSHPGLRLETFAARVVQGIVEVAC